MPDFNEDIVKAYFELEGYFVRMNVPYQPGDRGDESDIDIVAVNPVKDDYVACEVKGWHNERLTMSYWMNWPGLLNFTGERATEAVRKLIGERPFRHVLVVPPLGTTQRQQVLDYAAERGVERSNGRRCCSRWRDWSKRTRTRATRSPTSCAC